MKTIALAYLNEANEVVAWSADTFGSPREYPKTYGDGVSVREMLSKKFKTRELFGEGVSRGIGGVNLAAGIIMEDSLKGDRVIFEEKGVVKSQIMELPIETDYKENLPKWAQVKESIDNKTYTPLV